MNAVAATVARRAARTAAVQSQRRNMGGHAPAPEWTGIDKVVRDVFPQDYQLAGAILGGYGTLIALATIKSKMSSSPEPEPVAAASSSVGAQDDIPPAVDSADFEGFVESDAFTKFLDSEESIMKWVDTLDK
uniref:Uncharacterized protein n=1 Tax=Pseudictyota dubia TaxID=2749911 RepID=A0A7R9W4Z7_9STRA